MHFADLFEAIADEIGDREALACGHVRRTWHEYESRASRLARAFTVAGLKPGAKIAFYLYNGTEYCEAYFATLKIRGCAVNINYRYVEQELRYLLEYSDAEALVFHRSLGERVSRAIDGLAQLRMLVEVDDGGAHVEGAVPYELLVAAHAPARRIERSDDDPFMNFTGGTTGLPKGVVYRMGDVADWMVAGLPSFIGMQATLTSPADVAAFVRRMASQPVPPASLPACPLMHTAGLMTGLLNQSLCGAKIVTLPSRSFDAKEMLRAVERERITFAVIVGDAFCRPILNALDDARASGHPYRLTTLRMIVSSGVAWSVESKRRLLEHGDFQLVDAMGATEGGMGMSISNRSSPPQEGGRFMKMPDARVFTEDGREVVPGSGEAGYIAAGGAFVPVAYYKDPEKSARTFRVIDGKRYAFIGDMGTIETDGTLKVLGRGSGCINTAGEKVFPEEVEKILARHPDVADCLVIGVPDERFGQSVAAIVATRNHEAGLETQLVQFCREHLAAYKCPRQFRFRDSVERGPNGKPDYGWARGLFSS